MTHRPSFNEKKATQAAARFLILAKGKMNYMKLIKLLYLMDREALLRWARSVTNDEYYSMKFGPVLSEVHDLITEQPSPEQPTFWSRHISDPTHYEIELTKEPGDDELSEAEEDLIQEIHSQYGRYAPFDLVKLLHQVLPEWKEVQHSRVQILYSEILAAGKKTPEEIAAIESELDSVARIQCFASR